MADNEKKNRSPLLIIAVLAVAAAGLAAAVWLTRPQEPDPADMPPPEMGPDMAQASPILTPQGASPGISAPAIPTAAPDPPGSFNVTFEDETLSFKADLPEGPANDPVLAHLHNDTRSYLAKVRTDASSDIASQKKAGQKPRPWEVRISWDYTAKADGIVSLVGEASEYSGGAHPNLMFDTFIGRTTGEKLSMDDMLILKRSPSPAMTIAICEALKVAKTKKIQSPTIFDEPIVCAGPDANAKTDVAKIALAPSSQPDRFGGLYAYYGPYDVGAYAEGPYVLLVQQEVFAEDLRPEFKTLFAGQAPAL